MGTAKPGTICRVCGGRLPGYLSSLRTLGGDLSTPVWIDCETVAEVPEPGRLREAACQGRHVVLRIKRISADGVQDLMGRLAQELRDHSVFLSGGGVSGRHVTVMPVVSRERIRSAAAAVCDAMVAYQAECRRLVDLRGSGRLADEWEADEHGEHCRFSNRRTQQVVEAPLEATDAVDPYFFAEFVRSTPGHERVAALITEPYHDSARILEVVGGGG